MFGRLAMGFANVRAGTRTRVLMLVLVQADAEVTGPEQGTEFHATHTVQAGAGEHDGALAFLDPLLASAALCAQRNTLMIQDGRQMAVLALPWLIRVGR